MQCYLIVLTDVKTHSNFTGAVAFSMIFQLMAILVILRSGNSFASYLMTGLLQR
jgi:hypothetical protein